MPDAIESIFFIVILIISVVIHEISHGYAALALGDRTAQYEGRLTLNPLPHLDLFGSIILPLLLVLTQSPILLGWAKPVPYNPYNLRNLKWGSAIVAIAGPAANVALAVFFGLLIRFLPDLKDGVSGLFLLNFMTIAGGITFLNLVLALFNLVPIPPLDGSKLLFALLPVRWRGIEGLLEQYGFILLLLFIFLFGQLITPLALILYYFITASPPMF